jgi:hypothetical protein
MIVPDISDVAFPPANPRANRLAVGDGVLRVIVTEIISARTREDVNRTNTQAPNNLLQFIAQIPLKDDNLDIDPRGFTVGGQKVKKFHHFFLFFEGDGLLFKKR